MHINLIVAIEKNNEKRKNKSNLRPIIRNPSVRRENFSKGRLII